MEVTELQDVLSKTMGDYFILTLCTILVLAFKDVFGKIIAAFLFFVGKDFDVDDVVYIEGKKKARILRVGPMRTTFLMEKTGRKLVVYNTKLGEMMIEKSLPNGKHMTSQSSETFMITHTPNNNSVKNSQTQNYKNTTQNWRMKDE